MARTAPRAAPAQRSPCPARRRLRPRCPPGRAGKCLIASAAQASGRLLDQEAADPGSPSRGSRDVTLFMARKPTGLAPRWLSPIASVTRPASGPSCRLTRAACGRQRAVRCHAVHETGQVPAELRRQIIRLHARLRGHTLHLAGAEHALQLLQTHGLVGADVDSGLRNAAETRALEALHEAGQAAENSRETLPPACPPPSRFDSTPCSGDAPPAAPVSPPSSWSGRPMLNSCDRIRSRIAGTLGPGRPAPNMDERQGSHAARVGCRGLRAVARAGRARS